jgi:hypothetical protein
MNATQYQKKVAETTKGTKANAKLHIETIDEIKTSLLQAEKSLLKV